MPQPFSEYNASASRYRYGFNGKENDNDVKGNGNQQDYGARIYDSRVGRFYSIDPLMKKYAHESNYAFVANSPLLFKDMDGNEKVETITFRFKDGYTISISKVDKNYFEYEASSRFGGGYYFTKASLHSTTTIDLTKEKPAIDKSSYQYGRSYINGTEYLLGKMPDWMKAGDNSSDTKIGFQIMGTEINGSSWSKGLSQAAPGSRIVDLGKLLAISGNYRDGPVSYEDFKILGKDAIRVGSTFENLAKSGEMLMSALGIDGEKDNFQSSTSGQSGNKPAPVLRRVPSGFQGEWIYFLPGKNGWVSKKYPDSVVPGRNGAPDTSFEKIDRRPDNPKKPIPRKEK